METQHISIARSRTILDANFVHRNQVNWPQKSIFSPPRHFLYYQQAGERSMEDWEERFSMVPGDVIFFYAGRAYDSYRPTGPYRAMNIHFEVASADECQPGRVEERPPANTETLAIHSRIPTEGDPAIQERFADIVQLTHSLFPLRRRKAASLLEDLLIELAWRSGPLPPRWSAPVEYVIGFIDRNLDRKIQLDELADLVGMSRRTLTRRFRQATGRSIATYHLEKRMALAASLLRTHPDISLREVAETLGFYDEFHFSRAFRQRTGVSPTTFRQRLEAT